MTTRTKRALATLVAMSLSYAGLVHAAPLAAPALIGTEQAAAAAAAPAGRAQLQQTLARPDVVAALQARGVSVDAARERVAALTDAEAAQLAAQIDQAPAGADLLGTIVFLFVLLLITDILGFTKVFPFTRAVR